jgi:hypothetical protein
MRMQSSALQSENSKPARGPDARAQEGSSWMVNFALARRTALGNRRIGPDGSSHRRRLPHASARAFRIAPPSSIQQENGESRKT